MLSIKVKYCFSPCKNSLYRTSVTTSSAANFKAWVNKEWAVFESPFRKAFLASAARCLPSSALYQSLSK
jgi:hypothetical protein